MKIIAKNPTFPEVFARLFSLAPSGAVGLWLLFCLVPAPLAASFLDPHLPYQTTQTAHFRIHHSESLTPIAERVAGIAEEIYQKIGLEFSRFPSGPVQVVLIDQSDEANGFATVLPYNLMILRVVPPTADSSLAYYDDWLRLLFAHEYLHIVHLSDAGYPARLLKFLFGTLVAPNALSPNWVSEGLATYYETALTEAGRGRSSFTEMILRTDILNDEFLAIDQAAGTMYDWPAHRAPYLYGVAFWQYLAERYGREKLVTFSHKYGASLWFFSLNNKARRVFGKSFYTLWQEWKQSLQEKYFPLREQLAAAGLEEGTALLARPGENLHLPTLSPTGDRLVYLALSPHHKPEVRLDSQKKDRRLFTGYTPTQFAWSPDGKKLAFTAGRAHQRYYYYHDLFHYDFETKRVQPLTKGARVRDPAFSPDGKKIALSQHGQAGDRLVLFDLATQTLTPLTESGGERRIDHLSWSPSGKEIAASVWQPGGARPILVYNTQGKILSRITKGHQTARHPIWSRDGRFLYFVSDEDGIFNIYRYDWRRQRTEQITRVLSGAFHPSPSVDGESLVFEYYTGRGYSIRTIPAWCHMKAVQKGPDARQAAEARRRRTGEVRREATEAANEADGLFQRPPKPYSPWSTALLPHYLRPDATFLDNAIFVAATIGSHDPLFRHHWYAVGTYRTDAQFLGTSVGYTYSRFRPSVSAGYSLYAVNFGNLFGIGSDFFERRHRGFVGTGLPLGGGHSLSASYFFEDRRAESAIPAGTATNPVLGRYAGLATQYSWSRRETVPAAISPEDSYWFRAHAQLTNSFLGASERMEQTLLSADARQYLELPWGRHHVLAFRQAGGMAFGDRLTQGTFGLGGSLGESILASASTRTFTLRGLPLTTFLRDRALVFSAEYRIPLFSAQRGPGTLPIALNQASLALFADYGNAWNAGQAPGGLQFFDPFLLGVGMELRGQFILGYHLPIMGRLGYAIIVHNRDRVAGISDPILGQDIQNGILILELGTSF